MKMEFLQVSSNTRFNTSACQGFIGTRHHIGRSINDFSHQPHTIHADPAIAPAVDVRSRPKTPPIAATIPITAGPLGLSAKVSAGGLAGNTIHSRRASPEIVNIGPSPFVEPVIETDWYTRFL